MGKSKEYVVKVSKEFHASLEEAARVTGLSMREVTEKILRGQLNQGLPSGNMADLKEVVWGKLDGDNMVSPCGNYLKLKGMPLWLRKDIAHREVTTEEGGSTKIA